MPKPNFTVTWSFNHAGSVLQFPAPSATILVIDHHEPKFGMSRTHVVGETRDIFSLDLNTDDQQVLADRDALKLRVGNGA